MYRIIVPESTHVVGGLYHPESATIPHLQIYASHGEALLDLNQRAGVPGPTIIGHRAFTEVVKPTEITRWNAAKHPIQTRFDAAAEFWDGNVLVGSGIVHDRLRDYPGDYHVGLPAAMIGLFRRGYDEEIFEQTQIAFLELGPDHLVCYVYDRRELVAVDYLHSTLPDDPAAGFRDAVGLHFGSGATWRRHLRKIVVCGFNEYLCNDLDWLEAVRGDAAVDYLESRGKYREDPEDRRAAAELNRRGSILEKTAYYPLVAACGQAVAENHGSEYTGRLSNRQLQPAKGSNILGNLRIPAAAAGVMVWALTGLLAAVGIVGYGWCRQSAEDRSLDQRIAAAQRENDDHERLKREIKEYREVLDTINARVETLNKLRTVQATNTRVVADLYPLIPPQFVLTKVDTQGQNISVAGYVVVPPESVKPGQPVQRAQAVEDFLNALRQSGKFADGQITYTDQVGEKSQFTVSARYAGFVEPPAFETLPLRPEIKTLTDNPNSPLKTAQKEAETR